MPDVTRLRTEERESFALDLDEIAREGARRMLAQALEAEVIPRSRAEDRLRGRGLLFFCGSPVRSRVQVKAC